MSELRDAVAKQTELARFRQLFEGNPDCHGLGSGTGMYVPVPPDFGLHLSGFAPIGIYPIWQNTVHWGCIDIDEHDASNPVNLQEALFALGIHSVIELSRSKGYHVWVFLEADTWMQASAMRRALLVACDVAGAPAKEVNPKQEQLAEGQVGNYVRLPYPGVTSLDMASSQVFALWANGHFNPFFVIADALEYAEAKVNHYKPILDAADLWKPPERKQVELNLDLHDSVERGLSESVKARLANLPFTRRIMEEGAIGPDEAIDRSSKLVHLAYLAQESGFTASETLSILVTADLQPWCMKYIHRDHSDRELRRIVQRVFG